MSAKRFLILGGYGITGSLIANYLLQYSGIDLIIAGRDLLKADAAAVRLNREHDCSRASGMSVDASNYEELLNAFKNCDFVLAASCTSQYTENIVKAALSCGIDYMDINYSTAKVNFLKSISGDIKNSGRCFITDGGFHPGLSALLVRFASKYFDKIETANVASLIKENWVKHKPTRATTIELLEETKFFDTRFYKNGSWYKPKYYDKNMIRQIDFGSPFGIQKTYPMFLAEMEAIPGMFPSLKDTGFFVGGFNSFVDYLILPGAAFSIKNFPATIDAWASLMEWGLTRFSKPPYKTILKLEASGWKDDQYKKIDVTLSHEDGYIFTAVPVAACILQYLDGAIYKPGLHFMAHVVKPDRMMDDLKKMGIELTISGNRN